MMARVTQARIHVYPQNIKKAPSLEGAFFIEIKAYSAAIFRNTY